MSAKLQYLFFLCFNLRLILGAVYLFLLLVINGSQVVLVLKHVTKSSFSDSEAKETSQYEGDMKILIRGSFEQ